MAEPEVSVLIPTRNERRWIESSSRAMLAQSFTGEIEFLFIDANSTDGTREALGDLARTDSRVRVLEDRVGSIPHALNTGLREGRGQFVVRMDAHTFFPSGYVQAAVGRLRRGGADWVAGPTIPVGANRWSNWVAITLGTELGRGGSRRWAGDRTGGEETELDTGVFCGAWRRRTLEAYGGWNEQWQVNEDAELAARMLADGRRIVQLPELGAQYVPRSSPTALARQYWRYGFYRAKTARAHPIALRREHLAAPALVALAAGTLTGPRFGVWPRRMLAAYAALIAILGASRTRGSGPQEAAGVAATMAIMHFSWGTGFLLGCLRNGPPLEAVIRTVTSRGQPPTVKRR